MCLYSLYSSSITAAHSLLRHAVKQSVYWVSSSFFIKAALKCLETCSVTYILKKDNSFWDNKVQVRKFSFLYILYIKNEGFVKSYIFPLVKRTNTLYSFEFTYLHIVYVYSNAIRAIRAEWNIWPIGAE